MVIWLVKGKTWIWNSRDTYDHTAFAQRGLDLGLKRKGRRAALEKELRWMELESVIQSEVSQKEKNKYSMLTHIYGI